MPLYEYECDACGERFELIQKFSDGPPETCPKCGKGPVQRLVSSPAFQFKGTGWYITDYARKGGSAEGESSKSEGSKSDAAKKTDSSASSSSSSSEGGTDAKKSDSASSASSSTTTSKPAAG